MAAVKKTEPRPPVPAKPREDVTLEQALESVNEAFAKTLAYLGR